MPKVYIASASNVNYEHLEEFGEVVKEPVTIGFVDLSDIRKFYDKVKTILDKTQPDDFLALSGSSIAGVVISNFWINKHGLVRLLSFDKRKGPNGGYREVVLPNTSLIPDDGTKQNDSQS
jgi:hypothetical protein